MNWLRIIFFEVNVGSLCTGIEALHFDWLEGDASLLSIGWWEGRFYWDFLFLKWVTSKVQEWKEK
jgi:hypothetical protein